VYHLALRAAQGLAKSVFGLLQVSLPVPTYSTLSRRGALSEVVLSRLPSSGPVYLVLDSSGFKVYGESEWKVRQHGWSKRRTWRKLHLGVDEATGEIVAVVASEAVVKYGRASNGKERYRCQQSEMCGRTFIRAYAYPGRTPQVKRQIVEMTLNGSGVRDIARVLQVSPSTVIGELKKRPGRSPQ
jgi:hypothetical protein